MRIRGQEINPSCIVSLNPELQSVVLKVRNVVLHELADMSMNGMIRVKLSEGEFQLAKFEYLRLLKTRKDPENRVDPALECRSHDGGIDFKRMEELIELRKTPVERQAELEAESALLLRFKKANMAYHGPLRMNL